MLANANCIQNRFIFMQFFYIVIIIPIDYYYYYSDILFVRATWLLLWLSNAVCWCVCFESLKMFRSRHSVVFVVCSFRGSETRRGAKRWHFNCYAGCNMKFNDPPLHYYIHIHITHYIYMDIYMHNLVHNH